MASEIKARISGGLKLKRVLKEIKTTKGVVYDAEVGFFPADKYDNGMPVAEVAKINNFGLGVPQRPFFSQAIIKYKNEKKKLEKTLFAKKLNRRQQIVAVEKLATIMRNTIFNEIKEGRFVANKPATIRAKTAKSGGEKNQPLIDTGLMKRSVRQQIKSKKE